MGICSSNPKDVDSNVTTSKKSALDAYEIVKVLGKGASCEVSMVKDRSNKKKYALKVLKKSDKKKEYKESEYLFNNEVKILQTLKHPNILEYIESFEDKNSWNLVTSYCAGGELFDKVLESEFSEKDAAKLVKDMLLALKHCHENNIVHRDLKPENFVFEDAGSLANMKLIDFGCALKVKNDEVVKDVAGSPYYVAPEVLHPAYKRTGATWKSSDMWSVGVMIYLLLHGYPPFNGEQQEQIFFRIKKGRYKIAKDFNLSESCKDLIHKCLTQNPSKRITADEALKHPWLTEASSNPLPRKIAKNIKNFKHRCALKKAVGKALTGYMTDQDKKTLGELFRQFDTNGDGTLDLDELQEMMKYIGRNEADAMSEAKELLGTFDDDKSGALDEEEFIAAHATAMMSGEKAAKNVFQQIDKDGDGTVTVEEIEQYCGDIPKDQIIEMVKEVDKDNDGTISLEEWIDAMYNDRKKKKKRKKSRA